MSELKFKSCLTEGDYKEAIFKLKQKIYESFKEAQIHISTVEIVYFDHVSGKFDAIAYIDISAPVFYVEAESLFAAINIVLSWSKREVNRSLARVKSHGCAPNVTWVGLGSDGSSSVKYITVKFSGTTNAKK